MTLTLYCRMCHSPRSTEVCKKCGSSTFKPCEGWENPAVPDVDRIRALAREVGYAIGEHGTKERDLDLIAVPWVADAVGNYDLIRHIAEGMDARILEIERKPLGRYATSIQIDGYFKVIDLSVVSLITPPEKPVGPENSNI